MASDCGKQTLGDYFTLQRGTTYKSRLLEKPGPVLLGLASIHRNGGFRANSLRTYGGESPAKLLVQPGELYVSLKDVTQSADLLGAVARVPRDHPPGRLTQDTVKLEPRDFSVPLDYFYWLLRTPQYRGYCRAHATGTTNLGLSREDFLAFPASEPTKSQLRVVETLNALDEKIELNRRMSETLEAMARALFKSWFVDFDPVRAKAEGRHTGLPQHLADRFPDRLVESGSAEMPEAWEVGTLGDMVDQLRNNENPQDSPDVVFRHFSLPAYDDGQLPKHETGETIKSVKSRVPVRAVLLSKLNPEIERVWLVDVQSDDRAVCSTEFVVLAPRAPHGRSYLYCLTRSPTFRQELEGLASGTSGSHQRAQANAILRLAVTLPPSSLVNLFENVAEPLLARTIECRRQQQTLARLRDTLLPTLISGELRVERDMWTAMEARR